MISHWVPFPLAGAPAMIIFKAFFIVEADLSLESDAVAIAQFFLAFFLKRLNPNKRIIFTFSKSVSITSSFFAESLVVLVTKVLVGVGTNADVERARSALIRTVKRLLFMIRLFRLGEI